MTDERKINGLTTKEINHVKATLELTCRKAAEAAITHGKFNPTHDDVAKWMIDNIGFMHGHDRTAEADAWTSVIIWWRSVSDTVRNSCIKAAGMKG